VPRIALAPAQKTQLATLVEALLAAITATIAREGGNEQDHQLASGAQGLRLHSPIDGRPALAQP
jgi:hypothetical protein